MEMSMSLWVILPVLCVIKSWVSATDIVVGKNQARRMFDSEIEIIVNTHNEYRRMQDSSSMEYMYYHRNLEEQAMKWAQNCKFEHAFPEVGDLEWKATGQNLWLGTGTFDEERGSFGLQGGIGAWYSEIKDYNVADHSCTQNKVCGHYTQVVWDSSKYVGCSYNFCSKIGRVSNGHLLVCNYGPAGNWQGVKPFKTGDSCTQCKSGSAECDNGLCKLCSVDGGDCVCQAKCYNCGKLPTNGSNCVCDCSAGWTGQTCQESSGASTGSSCVVATTKIKVQGPPISYDNYNDCVTMTSSVVMVIVSLSSSLHLM